MTSSKQQPVYVYPRQEKQPVQLTLSVDPQQHRVGQTQWYRSPFDGVQRKLANHVYHLRYHERAQRALNAPKSQHILRTYRAQVTNLPMEQALLKHEPQHTLKPALFDELDMTQADFDSWLHDTLVRRLARAITAARAAGLTITSAMETHLLNGSDEDLRKAVADLQHIRREAQAAESETASKQHDALDAGPKISEKEYQLALRKADPAHCAECGDELSNPATDRLCFVCNKRFYEGD